MKQDFDDQICLCSKLLFYQVPFDPSFLTWVTFDIYEVETSNTNYCKKSNFEIRCDVIHNRLHALL